MVVVGADELVAFFGVALETCFFFGLAASSSSLHPFAAKSLMTVLTATRKARLLDGENLMRKE